MKQLTLKPLRAEDIQLVEKWLQKEYILKWYHEPEDWLTEINKREEDFSWIHHFIAWVDNLPIGFCQYYDCYDANDLEDWYEVTQKGHTFSVDYLIGEEAFLGKGYGKEMIRLLTELLFKKEKAKRVIAQPEWENEASKGGFLANGYAYEETNSYLFKDVK